jgi:3'-5' exoribonuclease
VRAIVIVEQAALKIDGFPEDSLREILHLIASHHGTNEWGSPVTPKTIEAVLLHQIDLLDSRIQGYLDFIEDDMGDGPWTLKNSPMFGTDLRYPKNLITGED